jgi:hypothetical protein
MSRQLLHLHNRRESTSKTLRAAFYALQRYLSVRFFAKFRHGYRDVCKRGSRIHRCLAEFEPLNNSGAGGRYMGTEIGERAEQREFVDAMVEAEKHIQRAQAALQRAKSKCHAEIYEHLDVISKRAYEVRVRSEWLRLSVSGVIKPEPVDPQARQSVDRRSTIDRRVEGMRKQVLAAS